LKPRPPGQAEGGTLGTDGWGHRRSTGLPPGYGRRGSNSHGPGPPASEAGASADSATSARGAGPRRLSRRTGARPARWTQTDSNRLGPPCKGGAPPLVRWAHESAGQESNLPCRSAWVTARCRPTTATRGGTIARPRVWQRTRPSVPLLAISSIVKVLFGRDEPSHLSKISSPHLQGRGESNPVFGGFGGRPATGAPPLRVFCRGRKSKEPLPCGSGSSGHGPMKVQFKPSRTPPWQGAPRTFLGRRRRAM
jgi:hypothetical protein